MRRLPSIAVAIGILSIAFGVVAATSCRKAPRRPNVLVLLLDTLRADHLGVYGCEHPTSPNIDRFAKESWTYRRAFTTAPWTPPAVATLFTGLYVTSHGMMPPDELPDSERPSKRLDENVTTLAELLRKSGYRTAAVSSNPWITPEFGFGQGFESFETKPDAPAEDVTDLGLARVDALRAQTEPFLLYLHYLDPHGPYTPPEAHKLFEGANAGPRYDERTSKQLDHYDGEIHYLDASLGRLFAALKERGLWDDLVVVLLGDHGEQFGEHGHAGHGWQLFNEELHVPLVLKPPRLHAPRSVEQITSTIDVLPTILAFAGVEKPAVLPGVSLLDEAGLAARRGVFAEIHRRLAFHAYVDANARKLIVDCRDEGEDGNAKGGARRIVGLYDAAAKDEPRIEDAQLQAVLQAEYLAVLDRVKRAKVAPSANGVLPSAETIERLQALGYTK